MIVRFHLHQNIDGFRDRAVAMRHWIGEKPRSDRARDHRRVVPVGGQHAGGILRMGGTNHIEQRQRHRDAIDDELRIEYLVPAMLGIRLREHHQLDVRGISTEFGEDPYQVVDLVRRQRKTPLGVGVGQRGMAIGSQCNHAQRPCGGRVKQARGLASPDRVGHTVVQQRS